MGECRRLPTPSHPPGGPQSLLAGGRASEAFRRPPTSQEGHLPPREVSLPPGGQNPITLEYQIYPPTIDTIVTGMPPAARLIVHLTLKTVYLRAASSTCRLDGISIYIGLDQVSDLADLDFSFPCAQNL